MRQSSAPEHGSYGNAPGHERDGGWVAVATFECRQSLAVDIASRYMSRPSRKHVALAALLKLSWRT